MSLPSLVSRPRRPGYICAFCSSNARALRPHTLRPGFRRTRPSASHCYSNSSKSGDHPVDDYYSLLLSQPLPTPGTRTSPAAPPLPPRDPSKTKQAALQKARVVFGSRLAGPAERRRTIDQKSTMIAGILVPPRPEEPDNCCMSGCVNCVWDVYRDDLEEWAAKNAEARRMRLMSKGQEAGRSVDEDGGGSEGLWTSAGGLGEGEDLFKGIPVGIREFMRTEKRLKERHRVEGSVGG
ncbi:MAG: hypothetical protein MMC33_001988 [Icmadophila ericetorum]|nr:hypothetical protein [Icmadophila ericetorum]